MSRFSLWAALLGSMFFLLIWLPGVSMACTRVLYVGDDGTVVTGRNMDWSEDQGTNLWAFPAGMQRDGAAGDNSVRWVSRYGSVVATTYESAIGDGMNEKGLVAGVLWLAESEYGGHPNRPNMSVAAWVQYVLDNYASVNETVAGLQKESFNLVRPVLPGGKPANVHLVVSDASGDSAIFEYIDGKITIHHDRQYVVVTNSPTYDQQIAINAYWKTVGGLNFLPGTISAADRFVRASFFINAIPKNLDTRYSSALPDKTFAEQAVASVLGVQRTVSTPLGIAVTGQPNLSSTIWRTTADQSHLVYFFDSATRPNTFWVALGKLDLAPGAKAKRLSLQNGEVYSGEVSGQFVAVEPFRFCEAQPKQH